MNRVYLVVEKIKDLARQQAIDGSKDINYEELVGFLRDLDEDDNEVLKRAMNDPKD